jgi:hypothetical protein
MSQPTNLPSFWSRLSLAFGAFFKTVGDAEFAARVRDDQVGPVAAPAPAPAPAPPAPEPKPAPAPAPLRIATPDAALQLLTLLQREARLIDFANENITAYATPTSAPPPASCTKAARACCASTSRSNPCAASSKARASRCRKASTPPACA